MISIKRYYKIIKNERFVMNIIFKIVRLAVVSLLIVALVQKVIDYYYIKSINVNTEIN